MAILKSLVTQTSRGIFIMSLKLKAQLKLDQQLSMTTELQQSIQLLSLNHQEIKDKIQEELLANPLLQTEDDHQEHLEHSSELAHLNTSVKNESTPQKIKEQVESYKLSSYNALSSESKDMSRSLEQMATKPLTLKDHLIWQTQISRLSEEDKLCVAILIFDLDDRGYLRSTLDVLAQKENLSTDQLECMLQVLQSMDPIGVGARDIKECLKIQARHLDEDTKDMILVIDNHLEDLKNKHYQHIASCLNISIEEVLDIYQIIQSMKPFPAQNFSVQPTEYIVPDVYIYREGDEYKISLNEDGMPNLRINHHYKRILNRSQKNHTNMKVYIQNQVQAGNWLIRSLAQRQDTMQKVVASLIKHQKDFLDYGFLHLKPLILQDIAEDISVHISTVSRVTSNKYVHTPQGLIPLKYFFNMGVLNELGQFISIPVIKYRIKEWITKEDITRPLSDSDLVMKILDHFHLRLSRRNVAQYRDSIGIPPISKRKKAGKKEGKKASKKAGKKASKKAGKKAS